MFSYFKSKDGGESSTTAHTAPSIPIVATEPEPSANVQPFEVYDTSLERDPGLRISIWKQPVNQRDEIRRAYIKMGHFQPILTEYPWSNCGNQRRRFQQSWFKQFPWIEYSPSKDALFCFPCFLFKKDKPLHPTFTFNGFKTWKRVNEGIRCPLLVHVGGPTSLHNNATKSIAALMDVSNKEQMAIILRFLYVHGILQERFFAIVHVSDTTASTLKKEILDVLTRCGLHIHDLPGQWYDGASNMCGAWNSLQALFLRDCPYVYYVHCFAHQLQLALVAAAENETSIWQFFSKLTCIVNLINASPKRHTELQSAQAIDVARMIGTGQRETGRGANQMATLHRAGSTRWSSHFDSICSIIDMYGATINVLECIVDEGSSNSIRGEAGGSLITMKSFDFMFILRLMHKIMDITNMLYRELQHKSLDILNAMDLVSSTKSLLQTLRQDGFDILFEQVESVCIEYDIDIPDMNVRYKGRLRRHQVDQIPIEHHYHFDIFNDVIDLQLEELNRRFNEGTMELLILSSALVA